MANLRPRRRRDLVYDYGFTDLYNMMDGFFNDLSPRSVRATSFKVDIAEEEDKYIIEAEMPGLDREDISLTVEDQTITISVEKDEERDESDEETNYIHKERRSTRMKRTMSLVDMDDEKITAKLDKGILTVEVGKLTETDTSKSIEIE